MASKPILSPFSVVTNGDMSSNITSIVTVIQQVDRVSYDVSWAGTAPVGTITVQVSNTYEQNADGSQRVAGDWNALPASIAVSGSTGSGFIDVTATGAYAIRLVYTRASGTGLLQAIVAGKAS